MEFVKTHYCFFSSFKSLSLTSIKKRPFCCPSMLLSVYLLSIKSRLCLQWMTDLSHLSVSMKVNRLSDSWDSVYLKCREFSLGTDSPARPPASPSLAGEGKETLLGKNDFTDASVILKVIPPRKLHFLQAARATWTEWVDHLSLNEITFLKQSAEKHQESWERTLEWEKVMNFLSTSFSDKI